MFEKCKLLCALNQKEQFGGEITENEKAVAVSAFLNGRNDPGEIVQYKKRYCIQTFLQFLLDGMNQKMYIIIDYKYIVNNNGRCGQKWKKKIKV